MKDKIISGQIFMYRTGGIPATCFAYKMIDCVDKSILQKAVDKAITRYPYFQCKVIEEQGDYFLVDNSLPLIVQDEVISLGGEESNYYLLGVCTKDDEITFSMHHGLCDGCGLTPFIQTTLYYYISYYYNISPDVSGIRLCDSVPSPTETIDPFAKKYEVTEDSMAKEEEKPFVLPETNVSYEKHYRWRAVFNAEEFYTFSHKYETGVSAVIALFMAKAISNIFPDEQKIKASLASDVRETVGIPDTFKNCIDSIILPYNDRFKEMELDMLFTVYTGKTIAQKQEKMVIPRVMRSQMLSQYLDKCPSLDAKRKMMKFTDQLTVNTFLVSYPGKANLGEIEKYIERAEVYGSGTNGLIIEVLSVNETVTLSIMQNFKTDRYVKGFCAVAQSYGLTLTVESLGEFQTPKCG